MGDHTKSGARKPIYYLPSMLTTDELNRYFQFTPALTNQQLDIVRDWYKKNTTHYAIIDEDYILFTLKTDYNNFVKFWLEPNRVTESQESVFIKPVLAIA